MTLKNLNIAFLIVLVLSVFLLPVLIGASIIDSPEEDNLADDDDSSIITTFPVTWIRIPVHQMSILLRLGISIFALFVVYLGGRSKHRRFNDRTIDAINLLTGELLILKTARIRAVFNFQVIPHPLPTNNHFVSLSHSILFLKRRSTKL
jgi:hypothetical protein